MKDINQSVFYTTAQVTEMVELSDQNVRKYVRLLEDRDYNVAKDEHNRRLFSGNDVIILKELITKAKQPGYTLETAADKIIEEVDEILSNNDTNLPSTVNDNDIINMFSQVMEKLDVIQEENRDLKSNINNLVGRLEEYDENAKQNYLDYAEEVNEEAGEVEEPQEEKQQEESEADSHASTESIEETEKTNADEENPEETNDSHSHNVDMGQYQSENNTDNNQEEKKPEKKGFFGGLFDFFKA
jgi:hypothetical protein